MIVVKQVADSLTLLRGFIALALLWLGMTQAKAGLPLAVWLLLISWTSDALDGPLARRSRSGHTWIGDHDLQFDIGVAFGLLLYLAWAGFIDLPLTALYVLAWALIFWRWSLLRSLGMFVQAPIYGWFIWTALLHAPEAGQWLLAWIFTIVVVTWPRFPQQVIPDFLSGMQAVWQRRPGNN